MLRNVLSILTLGLAAATGSWEWAAIFDTEAEAYTWTAQKVGGAYGHAHMKVVVLSAPAATEAALEALEPEAEHGWDATCTEVDSGETFAPTDDACFELHFDASADDTTFTISASGPIAIFTEHMPSEFERDTHYLIDDHGHDVDPVATEGGGSGDSHGHGSSAAASWEWGGIFATEAEDYTWRAQKVGGQYGDSTMIMAVLPAAAATAAALAALESEAEHAFEEACTEVDPGETIAPNAHACFELHFDASADDTTFIIAAVAPAIAIFTEHLPSEFERDAHYLTDDHGARGGGEGIAREAREVVEEERVRPASSRDERL